MIFLTPADLHNQIKDDSLTQILDSDNSILNQFELVAIEEITSYINLRYDTAQIFSPNASTSGDTRNPLIVLQTIDILLYHLWSRIAIHQIPDYRIKRYQDVIEYLKKVNTGTIIPTLPERPTSSSSGHFMWYSAFTKNRNQY